MIAFIDQPFLTLFWIGIALIVFGIVLAALSWLMREAYMIGYEHGRDGKPYAWGEDWKE